MKTWVRELYAINKALTLVDIFFPGSHDSGTYNLLTYHENWARTQDLTIYDQLCIGTRYLDMRLSNINGTYYVMHRFKYVPFSVVVSDISRFISETDEFIIMILREDWENRVEFDKFIPNVLKSLDGVLKYTTNVHGNMKIDDIYKGTDRVLIIKDYQQEGFVNIWSDTLSEDVLLENLKKELTNKTNTYYLMNFDYIYTIDGPYIAKWYIIFVIPPLIGLSVIAYLIKRRYIIEKDIPKYAIGVSLVISCILIGISSAVPLFVMPHLASQAKTFIRENINTKGLIPHIMTYDYVDEETNQVIVNKNFEKYTK